MGLLVLAKEIEGFMKVSVFDTDGFVDQRTRIHIQLALRNYLLGRPTQIELELLLTRSLGYLQVLGHPFHEM